jgi:hypothetical protein
MAEEIKQEQGSNAAPKTEVQEQMPASEANPKIEVFEQALKDPIKFIVKFKPLLNKEIKYKTNRNDPDIIDGRVLELTFPTLLVESQGLHVSVDPRNIIAFKE